MEELLVYFPDLSERQRAQLAALEAVYAEWNAQINVVSRADSAHFYERHVLHSLALAKADLFVAGDRVLDLGCGGGFPTVPLAILYPKVHFTAVDSIGKKIKVLSAVVESIGLTNVEAINGRAEVLEGEWSWVVSRAVAPLVDLLRWSRGKWSKGLVALKGGDLSGELSAAGVPFSEVLDIGAWFGGEFFSAKKIVLLRKSLGGTKK